MYALTFPASRVRSLLACAVCSVCMASAWAKERVVFATDWTANAAHGGFYQALGEGTFQEFGLEVEIVQGAPGKRNRNLLIEGKADFALVANLLQLFQSRAAGVPTRAVAAFFQKDPQVLYAHPAQGYQRLEDLRRAPIAFISKEAQSSWWQWLKSRYGFQDQVIVPPVELADGELEFSTGVAPVVRDYSAKFEPFLDELQSIQQGYAIGTDELIFEGIAPQARPRSFLLADYGFVGYAKLLEVREETLRQRPDLVRKFIQASIIGWYHYLYGDRRIAHRQMRLANPALSEQTLERSYQKILLQDTVDSGQALALGIGCIDPQRLDAFFSAMVQVGLFPPDALHPSEVVDTRFVNQGFGVVRKARLLRPSP